MSSVVVDRLVNSEWAQEARAAGKCVMVVGRSGRLHYVDPTLPKLLGRSSLGDNGFDLVPPELAAEGARMMAENSAPGDYTIWFPLLNAQDDPVWFRWECRWVDGLLLYALSLEEDPAHHHVHLLKGQ